MSLAQLALDLALRVRTRGPRGLGLGTFADELRRALIRAGDPLVRYTLAGAALELPLSHELPFHRALFPEYGANLGRLAAAVARARPGGSVVDVGANVGDTAAVVRAACDAPILCVEGDERFFAILRRNAARLPGVFVERALVGGSDGSMQGVLATSSGTGRVVAGGSSALRMESLGRILARWPSLPAPALVKIDTDGFDCAIVQGAGDVWERHRPVLFFEYDPAFLPADFDVQGFFGGLAALGYATLLVYENVGDFLLALDLSQREALEDLHHFYSGRGSGRYADLALFHASDAALAKEFRRAEHTHFDRVRRASR